MNALEMLHVWLEEAMHKLGLRTWRAAHPPHGLEAEDAAALEKSLVRLFEEQQLYLEPDLTVKNVAARMNAAPRFVAHVISTRLDENFPGFVNRKRAEAAAEGLRTKDRANITRIMLQSGFGSKTVFQKEFKRCIGVTPTEYRRDFLERLDQEAKVIDPGQRSPKDAPKP